MRRLTLLLTLLTLPALTACTGMPNFLAGDHVDPVWISAGQMAQGSPADPTTAPANAHPHGKAAHPAPRQHTAQPWLVPTAAGTPAPRPAAIPDITPW